MPEWKLLAAFAISLLVMFWASKRLAATLERIGTRLRFSDGLLGIVTALAADAPEICSAFAALLFGEHEVGIGVVIGSNIFNLAGLLGLSALVAGRVTIGRKGLWLNGGTSLLVSAVLVALVLQWLSALASLLLLTLVLVPYVALVAMHPPQIDAFRLHSGVRNFLSTAVGHAHRDAHKQPHIPNGSWSDAAVAAVCILLIIASSFAAVDSAVELGGRWGISEAVLGMLILAALTSIPNVIAAIHLAREGRGAAVVSESLNSNTLNILVGVCLPALLIGFSQPSSAIVYAVFWLSIMKVTAIVAASHHNGLHRVGGGVIVTLYLVFALAVLLWT